MHPHLLKATARLAALAALLMPGHALAAGMLWDMGVLPGGTGTPYSDCRAITTSPMDGAPWAVGAMRLHTYTHPYLWTPGTVTASGNPAPTYQWYKGEDPLSDGGNISGAATASLTASNCQSGDAGGYSVAVSGECRVVASDQATLTICQPVEITGQPSDVSINEEANAAFSVTATGDPPLSYQWKKGNPPSGTLLVNGLQTSGSTISGATTASLTITACKKPADEGTYYCTVSNTCPSSLDSTMALLTLNYLPRSVVAGSWKTLRTHTGYGEYAIVLNATRTGNGTTGPTVETRGTGSNAGLRKVQVTFDRNITINNPAAIICSYRATTGCPAACVMGSSVGYVPTLSVLPDGKTLNLAIAGPPTTPADAMCWYIDLSAPGLFLEPVTGDLDIQIRALAGDGNMNGEITLSDALMTRSKIGQSVASWPQVDYNLGGGITLADALYAQSRVGRKAFCPTTPP